MDNEYVEININDYQAQFTSERDFLLLDVREPQEFAAGRIPGSINIPMNEVPARMAEVPTDKPIVLVCSKGGRSAMVADFLADNGYTNLYNLVDGTLGWMMRGLPLED